MHTKHLPHVLTALAVVALLAACEDEPTPAKTTFPLANAPENVVAPDTDAARPVMRPGAKFGHGGPKIWAIMKHADELGLSEEQRSSVESIMDKAREDAPPMMREAFKGHMEKMGSLIKAETLDAAALTAGHDEMQARHREMRVKMFSTYLDALEVLSPEQRTKLFALQKEHKGMMGPGGKEGPCCMNEGPEAMAGCGCKKGPCCMDEGPEGTACPDCKMGHKGMKGHFGHKGPSGFLFKAIVKMGDEMELTAEQEAGIDALKETARADMAPLKDGKRALRKEMLELMTAAQLDRAAIEAKHNEILDARQEKESKHFALAIQALELLTVDQRSLLVTTLESCHPGKGMMGDGTCKKLFGLKKGGKHFHGKPPMPEQMPAW